MTLLKLAHLCFNAGSKVILRDVNLNVEKGEFITILGPSGSGKTSLLMSVAGFNKVSSGTVTLNGRDITKSHPRARNFGVVFQNYALFPHYTVAQNIAFPLRIRRHDEATMHKAVSDVAELVDLTSHLDKLPLQLSGGQQQRVALARALVYAPDIILLDEPLSALDVQLRGRMQSELVRIHREIGATIINVTHDQQEALSVSTRVVVMNEGRVIEDGTPGDIYHRPKTEFAANFIGDSNIISVQRLEEQRTGSLSLSSEEDGFSLEVISSSSWPVSNIVVKPEHLSFGRQSGDSSFLTSGKVVERRFAGEITHYLVETQLGPLRLKITEAEGSRLQVAGDDVSVYAHAPSVRALRKETL